MRALAPHIRNLAYRVLKKLVLNTKIPLLHVGPNRGVGDGDHAQRKGLKRAATCSYTRISGRLRASAYASRQLRLRRVLDQGWAALQRFRICLIALTVIVENPISASNGCLSVAPRIPCEDT